MQKSRGLVNTIPLLINELKTRSCSGLCAALSGITFGLSLAEYDELSELIKKAIPKFYQPRYYCPKGVFSRGKVGAFYWREYAVEPRVKWLQRQLLKAQKEQLVCLEEISL